MRAGPFYPKAPSSLLSAPLNADLVRIRYQALKRAEAEYREAESELLSLALAEYGRLAGAIKTLSVPGQETAGVQVTFCDRFSPIVVGEAKSLRKACGDGFEKLFREIREVRVKDPSDETLSRLKALLGERAFLEMLSVSSLILPVPGMDRVQFGLSPEIRAYLRQYKATVRVK